MKNTAVISAFPCCGKTTATNSLSDFYDFSDSDSSMFSWLDKEKGLRHPDFPSNYIEHIKSLIGVKDVVFVSTHKTVRQALEKANIPYCLVYPQNTPENKTLWEKRMKERNNDQPFIDFILNNWDEMIEDMESETFPVHYILGYEKDGVTNRKVLDANSLEDIISVYNPF